MVDSKITDLSENTDPQDDDLLLIVDDPGGSPVDEKITLANLAPSMLNSGMVYVQDNFNRTDSATVGDPQVGSAPTLRVSSTWGITSNQLAPKNSYAESGVCWGVPSIGYHMRCTIVVAGTDAGPVVRANPVSTASWIFLSTASTYTLYSSVGGYHVLGTGAHTSQNGDVVDLYVTPTYVGVYVNSVLELESAGVLECITNNGVGFRANSNTTFRADDFSVVQWWPS